MLKPASTDPQRINPIGWMMVPYPLKRGFLSDIGPHEDRARRIF
jgi:hypothetical protein